METKNLILAVVLVTAIVFVFSFIQNSRRAASEQAVSTGIASQESASSIGAPEGYLIAQGPDPTLSASLTHSTDVYSVSFSQKNASISQISLLPGNEIGNAPVELIASDEAYPDPFALLWNGMENNTNYAVEKTPGGYRFSREFLRSGSPEGEERIVIEKEYTFYPGEYIFDVAVQITFPEGTAELNPYALYIGPQIVEESLNIQQRGQDIRSFAYMLGGKRKNARVKPGVSEVLGDRVRWIGVSDKYFSLLLIPDNLQYEYTLQRSATGSIEEHAIVVQRPEIKTSVVNDVYRIYIGPKKRNTLGKYSDSAENKLGMQGLELERVLDARVLFGWLENILKVILQWSYSVFPNYGIAIIFLTLLVKLILLPLTLRSQKSMARIQELNPKIQELRDRHGNNKQKLNQELGELYRREKVNPLSGCMPMLIQFPFFIAMFGLFNNHFDLRGATFIAGWIDDLSVSESIWTLPVTIPIIGWDAIRGLPFIFLGTQLATIFVQPQSAPGGSSKGQAAFMKYGLPIFFFFLLYNLPAGLLVYWTSSNVLTMAQQAITLFLQKRKQHA